MYRFAVSTEKAQSKSDRNFWYALPSRMLWDIRAYNRREHRLAAIATLAIRLSNVWAYAKVDTNLTTVTARNSFDSVDI